MSFFVDDDLEPLAPPLQAADFAALIDRHIAYAEEIVARAEPGPNGVDWDRAAVDGAAIREHRRATAREICWLLELWRPETKPS